MHSKAENIASRNKRFPWGVVVFGFIPIALAWCLGSLPGVSAALAPGSALLSCIVKLSEVDSIVVFAVGAATYLVGILLLFAWWPIIGVLWSNSKISSSSKRKLCFVVGCVDVLSVVVILGCRCDWNIMEDVSENWSVRDGISVALALLVKVYNWTVILSRS